MVNNCIGWYNHWKDIERIYTLWLVLMSSCLHFLILRELWGKYWQDLYLVAGPDVFLSSLPDTERTLRWVLTGSIPCGWSWCLLVFTSWSWENSEVSIDRIYTLWLVLMSSCLHFLILRELWGEYWQDLYLVAGPDVFLSSLPDTERTLRRVLTGSIPCGWSWCLLVFTSWSWENSEASIDRIYTLWLVLMSSCLHFLILRELWGEYWQDLYLVAGPDVFLSSLPDPERTLRWVLTGSIPCGWSWCLLVFTSWSWENSEVSIDRIYTLWLVLMSSCLHFLILRELWGEYWQDLYLVAGPDVFLSSLPDPERTLRWVLTGSIPCGWSRCLVFTSHRQLVHYVTTKLI